MRLTAGMIGRIFGGIAGTGIDQQAPVPGLGWAYARDIRPYGAPPPYGGGTHYEDEVEVPGHGWVARDDVHVIPVGQYAVLEAHGLEPEPPKWMEQMDMAVQYGDIPTAIAWLRDALSQGGWAGAEVPDIRDPAEREQVLARCAELLRQQWERYSTAAEPDQVLLSILRQADAEVTQKRLSSRRQ